MSSQRSPGRSGSGGSQKRGPAGDGASDSPDQGSPASEAQLPTPGRGELVTARGGRPHARPVSLHRASGPVNYRPMTKPTALGYLHHTKLPIPTPVPPHT